MDLVHLRKEPVIPDSCFIDISARINGDVAMGEDCSVWFNVAIRGDVNWIKIGARTNIQDGCVFHTSYQTNPMEIGDDVSFGHSVIAHGCTIGSRILIGMQSLIMDGAVIEDEVLIGAGSLVTERTRIPAGSLAFGRPAKVIRPLKPGELEVVTGRAAQYAAYVGAYRDQGRFTGWKDNLYRRMEQDGGTPD